jgi:enoyl-CoA hydratase/carnithine racemase
MADALHEALTDVRVRVMRDRDARAVVLTGAGRAFSAGGDIQGFLACVDDVEHRRSTMRTARLMVDHILGCPVPVIAAVNGPAVGLGCSIAVACDIVLMADSAHLADTYVNVGQPAQAQQETKRALNLHLQHAALRVLPFALSAETESFSSPEVAARARSFLSGSGRVRS